MIETQQPWVFVAPDGRMPLCPTEALSMVEGSIGNADMEKVVKLFVEISVNSGVWCGVSKPYFLKEIDRRWKNGQAQKAKEALKEMILLGWFEVIENHTSWYSKILYGEYNLIICPGFALLDWILMARLQRDLPRCQAFP